MHSVYLWVKVFHVMFMVAWMASLLYLPRLFVYHADKVNDKITSETFKIMEYLEQNNVSKATEQHRFVLKLREAIGLCPSPPSAAHFLLNKYGSPLGYPRINWPSISESLGLELVDQIEKILSQN